MNPRAAHFAAALLLFACAPLDDSTGDLEPNADMASDAGSDMAPAMASDDMLPPDMATDMAPDMASDGMPTLDWQACDLNGQPDLRATCATLRMPLRRDVADGRTIEYFVKRVAGAEPDGRSLWMLAGGPGQAGDALEWLGGTLTALDPGLIVYLPDHRGTGRSSRLTCPVQEALDSPGAGFVVGDEWPPCVAALTEQYGADGLAGFSSHEAAADVADLIDLAGDPRPFVMGISYGTFLAHQYLLIAPEQAEGVIFDSACDPLDCPLSAQDQWEDRVGRLWLDEVCASDPLCAEKLGERPTETIEALYADLAEGHCPDLAGDPVAAVEATRAIAGQLMLYANLRPVLPAFMYRIRRCDPDDIAAIAHMYQNIFGGGQPAPTGSGSYSFPLALNIARAELWEDPPPSPAESEARYQATLMCRGVSRQIVPQAEAFTPYDAPLAGQRAVPETPTLLLQAEYDPATPLDLLDDFIEDFTGPTGHVVIAPYTSHTVVSQSPMADGSSPTCGLRILLGFLADPERAPDTACLDGVAAPDFAGAPGFNQAVFGTADLWEN